jgi:glucose/arabinose dehydrogenase
MASLCIHFYEGGANVPKGYENGIFAAIHGSELHNPAYGYEVRYVSLHPGKMALGSQVAINGWLANGQYWGRPVDVVFGKDGAMYVSDDVGGAV